MKYVTFGKEEQTSYKVCILVKEIRKDEIFKTYIQPYGLDPEEIIVIDLHENPNQKKTSSTEMKAYIQDELLSVFEDLQIQIVIVGDGDYFKTFVGVNKVDAMLGYVLLSRFGNVSVVYVPNYRTVFYDPAKVREKIRLGMEAAQNWLDQRYQAPGIDIIKFAEYPQTIEAIREWLKRLHHYPVLACDTENFSLKHHDAGIGTITFCWSQYAGIAFPVDFLDGSIRQLLREFFETYQGTLLYHGIAYDVYVLIYQLFMDHILDNEGLLKGLEVMLPAGRWHCTKLIAYLATNSCAGNKLSLKTLAQEFAGDYAQEEIKDIRKIPLPQLLQYNLIDGLATHYVYAKYWPILIQDKQLEIYKTLFQPATIDIIQMQLTGLPVDMNQVLKVEQILNTIMVDALNQMKTNPVVEAFSYHLKEEHVAKRNQKLKTKRITIDDPECEAVEFNPKSSPQLQTLLFDQLNLPVLAWTDAKQPSTEGDILKALQKHTQNPDIIGFLEALIDFKAVDKILGTFIKALKGSQMGPDGWHYLFGNFNLGGTVSGRLSSSGPNLQNLPANVSMVLRQAVRDLLNDLIEAYLVKDKLHLGKLIKSCFKAPPGWFFLGIDFLSLEDRISALTTKDPNKLKVYTDGYDGHSLRAHSYFNDQMTGIDSNNVESINSIAKLYPQLRQDSKTPTFLLTYGGTYMGIMNQMGWNQEKAQAVEARYHELYQVSDQWVAEKLQQACQTGYVTVAFGLRVRTPLLQQTILKTRKTPFEAEAEGRTAGNALGQSWCLLNSRAGSEFMGKVRTSDFRNEIKPCAQIHDAQYFLVRDNIDAIHYTNLHVVQACQWQDHPDIWHDTVKLGGELSLFYPTWADELEIPNQASPDQIRELFSEHLAKLDKKQKAAT